MKSDRLRAHCNDRCQQATRIHGSSSSTLTQNLIQKALINVKVEALESFVIANNEGISELHGKPMEKHPNSSLEKPSLKTG